MQTINCYIPLKLRLRGEPGEDDWANLEEVLVVQYSRALKRSIAELTRSRFSELGMLETVAEPFAQERMGPEGYLVPSYENGKPKRVPLHKHHKKSVGVQHKVSKKKAEKIQHTHKLIHATMSNPPDITSFSIQREFATNLSNEVLALQIQHLQERLLAVPPGTPEYETLRSNLVILEEESRERSGHPVKGPFPRDVAVFVSFLVRGRYIFKVASLLPRGWEKMTESELTEFLSERFTEEELRKQFLEVYGERAAIKATFRKLNIIAALVIGLVWARENIRKEEWAMAATKVGGMGVAAYVLNRLLYARDPSAASIMARKAGEFGRWFRGAARTNSYVNVLLLWQVAQEFLMSGAGGGPNIPFDIIQEIDIDDPDTWPEPDSTLLDFGFNLWYRQKCTPAHPEACTPTPVYIAKVEGSAIMGILKVLDIAPNQVPEIKQKLYRVEGDWGGFDILITRIPGRTITAKDNVLVVATGRRSGQLVSGRGHYRQLEVMPANEAAIALFGGREPQFVDDYLLQRLNFDNPLESGSQSSVQSIPEAAATPLENPPKVEEKYERGVQTPPKKLTVTAVRQKHHRERKREHTDRHQGSVSVPWSDDSTEFYHRIVEAIAYRFGINNAELWQPTHAPAYQLHSQLARNPNLHEGRHLQIRVGLYFDPIRARSVSDVQLEPEPVVRRVKASVEKAPSQPARITEAVQPAAAAPEQATKPPSHALEETMPRSTAQPEAGKSTLHEPAPLEAPTVGVKHEFEIKLPIAPPAERLGPIKVAFDDKVKIRFDGEISHGSPTTKITFSKKGIDFEEAAKTAIGKVKIKLAVEPDKLSKVGIGLDLGSISFEFSANVDWRKPFSISVKIPTPELKIELGEWTFKGKLQVTADLNISPNERWPGWATLGRDALQLGRSVAAALTGEAAVIIGGALVASAVMTGFMAYVVGREHKEGNALALGRAFSNGYARMLARLTSGEVVFDQRGTEFSRLLYFDWKSSVKELSKAYGAGGYDLSDVEKAGEAAAVQDMMRYISENGPEAWRFLSQLHRDKHGKALDQRRHVYLYKLYTIVDKLHREDNFIEQLGINFKEDL